MPGGKGLEYVVRKLFDSYRSRGIWCQRNYPERNSAGVFIANHGFDFEVLYNGKFYAFDTKECHKPRWDLSLAKPHQLHALVSVERNGGEGFFLVHFVDQHKLVKFHAHVVCDCIGRGLKSVTIGDGESTGINILEIK